MNKLTVYFGIPFRQSENPHLVGFNEFDRKGRTIDSLIGRVTNQPVDVARNLLVEDFLQKTKGSDDCWFCFIDDDILLPTDFLDLWLEEKKKNPNRVYFGNYSLKKRFYESAHMFDENDRCLLMATGICFIHKSVFTELRMKRISAYGIPYDGRWFICTSPDKKAGEDSYFTETLRLINVTPQKIQNLEGIHIDFDRMAAFGVEDVAKNGKIRKEIVYAYSIDPKTSPLYDLIVEK